MKRNVVLSTYDRATYLDQTQTNTKTCSQKFHLHVQFITSLKLF